MATGNGGQPDTLVEESMSTEPARFRAALKSVMACGDYEKLIQGVFENYLEVKFKDVKMQNVSPQASSSPETMHSSKFI